MIISVKLSLYLRRYAALINRMKTRQSPLKLTDIFANKLHPTFDKI